ncbi:uncharacterized protein VP01_569g7 [Puccinia sorghi]|uniref:LIM zinc-binding domain-containing protein n=1 Tax=Puccinia sorghi TaxID=27349 RepID=A0A0L6UIP1_9BASI|nr:uncharacterized protein VP01_569g7 [Puccinia sorghi]
MALAFFNAPALPALFGFSSTTATGSTGQDGRPESMSAEAIIKCSDCGGDVVLAQLGEHVCVLPSDQQQSPSSSPPDDDEPNLNHQIPASKPLQSDKTSLSCKSTSFLGVHPFSSCPSAYQGYPIPPFQPTHLSSSPLSSSNSLPITVSSSIRTRASTLSSSDPSTISSGNSSVNTSATSHSTALTDPSIASASHSPPTSASTQHQSPATATTLDLLKEKLLHSMRPELPKPTSLNYSGGAMSHKSKMTTSSSDLSLNTSDTSSSSNSSSARLPFLERYAQLTKTTIPTKPSSRAAEYQKAVPALMSKTSPTPITSPVLSPVSKTLEYSPPANQLKLPNSKSMPFSNLSRLGLASQRREALSREATHEPKRMPSSSSATSGLDKLIAREHEEPSWIRKVEAPIIQPSRPSTVRQPEQHSRAGSGNNNSLERVHLPTSSVSGLEDLMGDLMTEMSKKAELSSEEYQKRTRHNHHVVQKIVVPDTRPFSGSNNDYDYDPMMTPRNFDHKDSYGDDVLRRVRLGFLINDRRLNRDLVSKLCQACMERPIRYVKNSSQDEEGGFCSSCYAELYLPKCRKCFKAIEGGAVTDRVGKVLGKYHASCFNCYECHAPFPNGEFYVWERKPVCSKDYHRLAGTICCNEWCGLGIEGRCVSLILDSVESGWVRNSEGRKLYHAEHFCCSHVGCGMSLHEFHFVVNRLPWCEKHAHQQQEKKSSGFQSSNNSLARRRTIIIQNVL